ncbi:sugar isomerase domain-containing protein [Algoriphagus formosus]|uniref:sugar isomerase domain-containing protein n=1 Tax=Algoriphagus formosus TaxID=2007308 RepID=UPI003F6E7531
MEKAFERFHQLILSKLKGAFSQEKEILQASEWIASTIQNEGWVFTAGTGHSHLLAEEIFYRAGGFARVYPILDPPLMLHESASKSSLLEREEGYAYKILSQINLSSKDTLIIASNSGRNAVTIELAQAFRNQGAKVICITNLAHSRSVTSRHSSGLKLYQVSDLVLDNQGEIGDAAVEISGVPGKVGATSTVVGAALLQAIMAQAVESLVKAGTIPELFISANTEEGEKYNDSLLEKYKGQVPPL